jgi:hypothetical protein
MAAILQEMRPRLEVLLGDPDDLRGEVERTEPHFLLCSRPNAVVDRVSSWAVLYPDGHGSAVVSIEGDSLVLESADFEDVLEWVDRAAVALAGKSSST